MLQIKFEPNSVSGFNLSSKELLFESVDRQQTMKDNCLSYNSSRAFGAGELKSIKSVQAYMVNTPIKSQP